MRVILRWWKSGSRRNFLTRPLSKRQAKREFFSRLICVSADGSSGLQTQSFSVLPTPVSVHEGGEAVLRCQVANLGGQVQWVKDGLALGEYSFCNFTTNVLSFSLLFHTRILNGSY